jgi:2-methylcitrate dehydratase PrpD
MVLARFACGLSLDELAAPVIAAAKANIFDTLACAAAGSSAPAVAETRELAVEWGGAHQATILGFGDKIPAHHAAWVNGTMAHCMDFDDTHIHGGGHISQSGPTDLSGSSVNRASAGWCSIRPLVFC